MTGEQERERQGNVSEEESTQSSVSVKRRQLVKGLAGLAPGIFTLYSGNAFALASATQRCILSDRANFDETSVLASDDFFTDAYQRGSLTELAIEVKSGSVTKWLAGVPDSSGTLHWYEAEITATGQIGVSWSQSSQEWMQCADEGDKRTFHEPAGSCGPSGKGAWKQTNTAGKQAHALFCVNDDGNVVSTYPEECGTLRPVNRSCWASIDPGAPDPTIRGGWW